jgi:hypothetical protein
VNGYPKTYATFRIRSGPTDPGSITARLAVEPTRGQGAGEPARRVGRPARDTTVTDSFFSAEGQPKSNDVPRHIGWLLS